MASFLSPVLAMWFSLSAVLLCPTRAQSQPVCSSDGQPAALALFERFINADCETCWLDATTPETNGKALTLDWIVPGSLGEDAPLAAAARRDALWRLESQHWPTPTTRNQQTTVIDSLPQTSLRVAHGMALGGYVGASIELSLPLTDRLDTPIQAWLVLVESLPKGSEDSPVDRNLVRNVLLTTWHQRDALRFQHQMQFRESRPLNIPTGANPTRLRVFGWVEVPSGSVLTAAESVCHPED